MQQGRTIKVVLMMAQTVDGIIARDPNHFTEWTCSSDKRLFKQITQEAGVLIMGARTYATIGKPLPGRLNVVYTRHPERLPQGENVLFSQKPPGELLAELARKGYSRVILTGGATINSLFRPRTAYRRNPDHHIAADLRPGTDHILRTFRYECHPGGSGQTGSRHRPVALSGGFKKARAAHLHLTVEL